MSKILTREQCLSVFKHATYPDWVTGHPSILKANIDALYERVRVLEEQAPMDAYEKLDAAEAEVASLRKTMDWHAQMQSQAQGRANAAESRVAALERLAYEREVEVERERMALAERVAALEKALREIAHYRAEKGVMSNLLVRQAMRQIAREALEREEKQG